MNGADITAFGLIFMGFTALLFVAFVKIRDKLSRQYFVHWEDKDGNHSYSIIKACSKKGAGLKVCDASLVEIWITKVVRYIGE